MHCNTAKAAQANGLHQAAKRPWTAAQGIVRHFGGAIDTKRHMLQRVAIGLDGG